MQSLVLRFLWYKFTILLSKCTCFAYFGILWLCSFLSSRRQAVKFSSFITEWESTHVGVPQGTKLGPILFVIMINDLALKSPLKANHWKYVDDMSLSEVININIDTPPRLQSGLDQISIWSKNNNMNLNPKKCKEMIICPLKNILDLDSLSINNIPLDIVSSHKILGLKMMDTLKWNDNSKNTITKASKRIYIIRPQDLIHIYLTLIRPVLEYCCAVWSNSIPVYLSEKIEKVQKRVMRIVFPDLHYTDALSVAKCDRLDERRLKLCLKVLSNIKHPNSRLNHLLPPTRQESTSMNLRNSSCLSLPKCRTDRYTKNFFPAMAYI